MANGRKAIEESLIERAVQDPAFKALLLSDPRRAVETAGFPLPPQWTLEVRQETAASLYLVLPPEDAPSGALSDAALEQVAGGGIDDPFFTVWCG